MSIRILPSRVADKIAAGEVVERPASVLKELVENSLDAGATSINVAVVSGGRKLVAVSDNGSGMNRDDALLCIERHATSKISDVKDIEHIGTLGFRGEALAAICSVSRFTLKTCRLGDLVGTEITVSGGKLLDVKDIGCPPGTSVEVRDLFFNVPARRKFLRSPQTEQSHIKEVFMVQTLAHPAVGMTLTVNGTKVYELAQGASLDVRLGEMLGTSYREGLRRVAHENAGVSIRGYVSEPTRTRLDRNEQFVFVNNRSVIVPLISRCIREGYRTLLPHDRYPSVFLFVALDPGLVDVNVHPAKREVRFHSPGIVRDVVIEAIRRALTSRTSAGIGQEKMETAESPAGASASRRTDNLQLLQIEDLPETRFFKYPRMPMVPAVDSRKRDRPEDRETLPMAGSAAEEEDMKTAGTGAMGRVEGSPGSPWSSCRVLGQIGGLYVVLETEDGFVLMDPHAAHERVMFERFMADVARKRVESQTLLMPETVELTPGDARCVRRNLDLMREMGFGVSEFGADAFVVDALPVYFAGMSPKALLAELATALDIAGSRGADSAAREEHIAQAACKAAVKARERLTLQEIEELVVSLAKTEMPYTCPHGRPTLIFTSFKELNRKFGRE